MKRFQLFLFCTVVCLPCMLFASPYEGYLMVRLKINVSLKYIPTSAEADNMATNVVQACLSEVNSIASPHLPALAQAFFMAQIPVTDKRRVMVISEKINLEYSGDFATTVTPTASYLQSIHLEIGFVLPVLVTLGHTGHEPEMIITDYDSAVLAADGHSQLQSQILNSLAQIQATGFGSSASASALFERSL